MFRSSNWSNLDIVSKIFLQSASIGFVMRNKVELVMEKLDQTTLIGLATMTTNYFESQA